MAGKPKYARAASKQQARSYRERMNVQEYEDALRFLSRRKAEDAALGLDVPVAAGNHVQRGYPGKWAASKPRLRCHGAAAMPPTPEAAEDLANGLVPPTVLAYHREYVQGVEVRTAEVVRELSHYRPERGEARQARQAPTAAVAETAAATVQPALRHDYTA